MIVVDATVVTAFLLGNTKATEALTNEVAAQEYAELHAPELVDLETLNALRRLTRSGEISEQRAAHAVRDLARTWMRRYSHGPLRSRVWQLRDQLSAYDAAYLALAEAMEEAILVTGDRGLAERSRSLLGTSRVRYIGWTQSRRKR